MPHPSFTLHLVQGLLAGAIALFSSLPSLSSPPPPSSPSPLPSTTTPHLLRTLTGHTSWIYTIAFSPNGQAIATTSYDGTVRVTNWHTGDAVLTVPQDNDNDWFTAATFSPDGQTLLTSRSDGTLQLRDLQTGTVQSEAPWRFSGYGILAFTADGQTLIDASGQGGDFRIYLWDFQRRQAPRNIGGTWVTSPAMMAITPDGYTLAAGSNNGTTRIWNIRTGQPLSTLPAGATIAASSIALTPDGQSLFVRYGDGSVKQWNTRTGQLNRVLIPAGRYGGQAIAISPNGQLLAMNFGNFIRLWNLQTNRLAANLPANIITNRQVMTFSPDSRFLLNTDGDGSRIRVWQLN